MTKSQIDIDTGTDQLLCRVVDSVAVITLNRPEARNALSDQLSPALRRMIKERGEDERVRALMITGAGTAFCAGGDVKGMGDNSKRKTMSVDERVADLRARQMAMTGALMGLRKPTVAALPGPAVGAGLAIAMACDVRIAAASAFLSAGYSRIGLSGDYGIAWLLTRAIGSPRAREMMFTSERITAERAERIGLVNRVVPDAELPAAAMALARSMAEGPAIALRHMKDNLDDAATVDFPTALDREADRMVRSQQTADHREAVRAFIEKRQPVFTGM
jgi:enoyl-CoA hydratase/carnithine racemase